MNEKHSLLFSYNIKQYFGHLECNFVLIAPFQVKGHRSVPLHAEMFHCTVLFNDDVTYVQWSIYSLSRDPVLSNQITRI